MKPARLWNMYICLIITACLGAGIIFYWFISELNLFVHPVWGSPILALLLTSLMISVLCVSYFKAFLRKTVFILNKIIKKEAFSPSAVIRESGPLNSTIAKLIDYVQEQDQKLAFLETQLRSLLTDWDQTLEINIPDWTAWEKGMEKLNMQFDILKSQSNKLIVVNQSLIASDADLAQSMQKMAQDVTVTSQSANDGIRSVGREIRAINDLKTTMGSSASVIKDLGDLSKHVGLFINTIAAISHRTQLLSLNAGIEAARAGEAGRRFSVVANEIRTLSESSKKTTEDISALIHEIEQRTKNVIDLMQNTKRLEDNIKVVYTAGDTFMEIVRELRQINIVVEKTNQTLQSTSNDSELIHTMLVKLREEINKVDQSVSQLNATSLQQHQAWKNIRDFRIEMAKRLKSNRV